MESINKIDARNAGKAMAIVRALAVGNESPAALAAVAAAKSWWEEATSRCTGEERAELALEWANEFVSEMRRLRA